MPHLPNQQPSGLCSRRRNSIAFPITALDQHGKASSGKIGCWRIEQRTMIGERDVVEIVAGVVSVERSPSAVAALHTDDPLSSTRDGIMELRASGFGKLGCPIHRHDNNCGIIQIYVIWIDVLERPAARTHMGTSFPPIADHVKD